MIANSTPDEFSDMMEMSFVPRLVKLITSVSREVQEQAIWILDNIAQDFGLQTQLILESGALNQIVKALSNKPHKKVLTVAARLLRNLTVDDALKGSDYADEVRDLVPLLGDVLQNTFRLSDDVTHALCALTNLCERDDAQHTISEVFSCEGLVGKLMELTLTVSSEENQLYALNTLCYLSGGTDKQVKKLISFKFLDALTGLVQSEKPQVATAACHALSNMCGGSAEVIQAVIESRVIPQLADLAVTSTHPDVRTYAVYALMFAFHGSNLPQTRYLVDCGWLRLPDSGFAADSTGGRRTSG
eukprot:gene42263-52403_t